MGAVTDARFSSSAAMPETAQDDHGTPEPLWTLRCPPPANPVSLKPSPWDRLTVAPNNAATNTP